MPLIKEPPPRRRLGRTNGETIIAMFEGQAAASPSSVSSIAQEQQQRQGSKTNDENENIIQQLFPAKNTSNNGIDSEKEQQQNQEQEQEQPKRQSISGDNFQSDVNQYAQDHQPSSSTNHSASSFNNHNNLNSQNTSNQQHSSILFAHRQQQQQLSNQNQQQQRKRRLVSTEVQTDSGGAEFRLYELVLSTPSATGIVTREHAAHRAMLERQVGQRIVDARLDERFNRQQIEDARDLAMETIASAFKFHTEAMNDLMYFEERDVDVFPEENRRGEEEEENGEEEQTDNIDGKMIDMMNEKTGGRKYKTQKRRPRLVPIEKYHQLQDENYNLRQRVDLLERRLQVQSQGIPYLVNTVRFPAPPPSIEVLEREEQRLRQKIENLSEDLLNSFVSIWGTPSLNTLRSYQQQQQHQQSRNQTPQQQRLISSPGSESFRKNSNTSTTTPSSGNNNNNNKTSSRTPSARGIRGSGTNSFSDKKLSLEQQIQLFVVAEEKKDRDLIEYEERTEFRSEIEDNAANRFIQIVKVLNDEKEMYRLKTDLVVVVAAEEATRQALQSSILEFSSEMLETFYAETRTKTELTRKLRNSMHDQHNQMMRHKKEMSSSVLPPLADRLLPKNSSVKITPEARRAAAVALHYDKTTATTKSSTMNRNIETPNNNNNNQKKSGSSTSNSARKDSVKMDSMFPNIQESAKTPRPPNSNSNNQQERSASKSATKSTIGRSGFAGSSARAPLYNSGFSRPYMNL